jgi:hypothetical protein
MSHRYLEPHSFFIFRLSTISMRPFDDRMNLPYQVYLLHYLVFDSHISHFDLFSGFLSAPRRTMNEKCALVAADDGPAKKKMMPR